MISFSGFTFSKYWFANKAGKKSMAAMVPGSQGLSVAVVNAEGERPKLETWDYVPWQGGSASGQLLRDKVKQHGLSKRACTTVMELGDYVILSIEAPVVPPVELRAAVRWQIKDLIDFHIDDAVIDVFDAPASGAGGKKSMYVVVAKTSTVRERVEQLQKAEANLTTIDVPELALSNISKRFPEDNAGVVFVYLTAERGLILFTRRQTLYFARTLEIGYEFLRQGMGEDSGLSPASNNNFDRLVLQVQRSLDYYDRYYGQPHVAGLVLAPTELPIPGLDEYLHQVLGLETRTLDLSEILDMDEHLTVQQQARCLPAVGAALRQEHTRL
ncbi:MAG TPA: hypothetical protein VIM41_04750 [Gammaproteobacteria bacterium]